MPFSTMENGDPDREIGFRVGSRDFRTRLSTLAAFPESVPYRAVVTFPSSGTENPFWDRDETIFASLLDFMRTGRFVPPLGVAMDRVASELEFWGFSLDAAGRVPQGFDHIRLRSCGGGGGQKIRCPVGVSLRAMDAAGFAVLVCAAWSAICNQKALWEAAQAGHRQITLFWAVAKTRKGAISSGLLMDHLALLRDVAALDRCKIEVDVPVPGFSVLYTANPRDVITNGWVVMDASPRSIHAWTLSARIVAQQPRSILFLADRTQSTTFTVRGYRITLCASSLKCYWTIELEDQAPLHEPTVLSLTDVTGFLLQVKVVLGSSIYELFTMPQSHARWDKMEGDVFFSTSYVLPEPLPEQWYWHDQRHNLTKEATADGGMESSVVESHASDIRDVILLIEECTDMTLSCIRPGAHAFESSHDLYDRIRVSW